MSRRLLQGSTLKNHDGFYWYVSNKAVDGLVIKSSKKETLRVLFDTHTVLEYL